MDEGGAGHFFEDVCFGGVGSDDGAGVEELGDGVGFEFAAGEGFVASRHGGWVADDEWVGGGLFAGSEEAKGLDGGGNLEGVFLDEVLALIVLQGLEGDEEEFALGDEDDAIAIVFGQEVFDRFDQQFVGGATVFGIAGVVFGAIVGEVAAGFAAAGDELFEGGVFRSGGLVGGLGKCVGGAL